MKKGFSLVEVMIAIVLLGIILSLVVGKFNSKSSEHVEVEEVEDAITLNKRKIDYGIYLYEIELNDGTKCVLTTLYSDGLSTSCNWNE